MKRLLIFFLFIGNSMVFAIPGKKAPNAPRKPINQRRRIHRRTETARNLSQAFDAIDAAHAQQAQQAQQAAMAALAEYMHTLGIGRTTTTDGGVGKRR